MLPVLLTPPLIRSAVDDLSRADRDLAAIARRHGPPPLWGRPPGYATLARIILEQQVSLKAARSIYARLQRSVGRVTASRLARCTPAQLQAAGLTGRKSEYLIGLAQAVVSGDLDVQGLADLDDEGVREQLTAIRGIGRWTSDVYLLMVLRRPDVWPNGDLALAISAQRVKRLRQRPDDARLERMARHWKPWRSVAARLLWQDYLAIQRRRA